MEPRLIMFTDSEGVERTRLAENRVFILDNYTYVIADNIEEAIQMFRSKTGDSPISVRELVSSKVILP